MSRLLAAPFIAVIIGVLACGTPATEALPTSAPTPSPAATPASNPESEASFATAPALTRLPSSTAVAALTPLPSPALEPTSGPTEIPADPPADAPARAAIIVDQPEVGTKVGDTVPHFEFTLINGARRSTAQLASQGRPVFLFFHATW